MRIQLLAAAAFVAALCLPSAVMTASAKPSGKSDAAPTWDVNAPHGPQRRARLTVDEGTWMNLDVSPDGQRIAFDLLGDIYLLPIEGGKARRVLGGKAFEHQPRFRPDGQELSFTSDRGGADNIWRVGLDGKNPVAVTAEKFRLLNNAAWTPDGEYLVARKHFTATRSLGAGEMWLYHRSGGDGLQLTTRKNDQQDAGQPQFSPDGRSLYFSEDMSAGPSFQYNKDPNGLIYGVRRLDRETGELENLITLPGGAVSPTPSPDGHSLAFVRRVRDKTVLHRMDLDQGTIQPIWDGLSHDQQEAWAIFGPYPNFAWLPDSSAMVIWAKGKLWRVAADGSAVDEIPFSADVDIPMDAPVRSTRRLPGDEQFAPQMIRDVATSPDGKQLVFHAVGRLWRKALPNGTPQPLTGDEDHFEYAPAFSADGQRLLYTAWHDEDLGSIRMLDLDSGRVRVLSSQPGFYFTPRFSADGERIVYARQAGGNLIDYRFSMNTGIFIQDLAGGAPRRVARRGSNPMFSADGQRVLYLERSGNLAKTLRSVGLNGEDVRELYKLKYADFVVPSPDGKWLAFTELFGAYVVPMPATGSAIELSRDTKAVPVRKVSGDVGSYLHWSHDGQSLHWMVGREYHTRALTDLFAFLPGAPKELPKPGTSKGLDIGLQVPRDRPSGTVALVGARVISMRGDEVLENATVLIDGELIAGVGTDLRVPADARVIDVSGKTIMPGIIDVHAHANHFHNGPSPQANWAYYANLAFGVTTMHDPSANTQEVFSQAELVLAGRNVGPRVFSTGTILYGADGDFKAEVNSLEDARAHLRRLKAQGAFSVKSYNQPRRDQRQQINQAARELDMLVLMEGGSTFVHNLGMVMDGSTAVEHNLPIAPLYADVLGLWKATEVRNTPTLVVSFGGMSGEYWWYQHSNVWENQKLLRFFPRESLDARSIRRQKAPDWGYYHLEVARAVKQLHDVGTSIQVGGHGQMQGLAPHWELWMLHQGGFSEHEALRAATLNGAEYLGMARDLGSIEVGKRADLVVLNGNPLDDIQYTADNQYVMVNGRLFEADTMVEIGGRERPAPVFYWQRHGGVAAGMMATFGPTAECHCPKSAR